MVIDGRKISSEIIEQLKKEVAALPFKPKLVDVLVGKDPVTESYVNIKSKRAAEVGIDFEAHRFVQGVSQAELESAILKLNKTENLCGLIVQLPLPANLDKQKIIDQIDPHIDVDVITSSNLGKLFTGESRFVPATAGSIMKILEYYKVDVKGKHVLMVGAGDLVGKPVAFLLMQKAATVIVANQFTQDLANLCLQSEVIISGTGVPKLITGDMVRAGAVVIDAGTAESAGGITGDVDFEAVKDKAALVSPVPGGVGPITVAMLLNNVVLSANARD